MSTKTFTVLVHSIIRTGDQLQAQCKDLTTLASAMSLKDYRNALAGAIGEYYTVEPHESRKGKGILTFTKDTAAEQKLSKLVQMHPKWENQGGNAKHEPKAITKAQKAIAKEFAAEFDGETLAEQVRASIAALKALL